ncbi:hypothetical protein SISNIDRAFT_401667, partial [Sistotremastrum niveocremeum HHB9708]
MSLVLWIATNVKGILDILAYIDDSFGWDFAHCLEFYAPYNKHYPSRQVQLLKLWDELGIPHEERKQLYGSTLPIIGFNVDIDNMSVAMVPDSKTLLVSTIRNFVGPPGTRRKLLEFQRVAGSINWALNVHPRLRVGLSSLYEKMAGKTEPLKPVWVSEAVRRELLWIADHLVKSDGILFLKAAAW